MPKKTEESKPFINIKEYDERHFLDSLAEHIARFTFENFCSTCKVKKECEKFNTEPQTIGVLLGTIHLKRDYLCAMTTLKLLEIKNKNV